MPDARPIHRVAVDAFWMDRRPVTVAQFRRFVKATGYVTLAERAPDAADYPDADPALLVPGALVFRPTRGPVDLRDVANWWNWVPGARWDRPEGPGSDTDLTGRAHQLEAPTELVAVLHLESRAKLLGEREQPIERGLVPSGGLDRRSRSALDRIERYGINPAEIIKPYL